MLGSSWVAAQLAASHEGFGSTELVNHFCRNHALGLRVSPAVVLIIWDFDKIWWVQFIHSLYNLLSADQKKKLLFQTSKQTELATVTTHVTPALHCRSKSILVVPNYGHRCRTPQSHVTSRSIRHTAQLYFRQITDVDDSSWINYISLPSSSRHAVV
jgi:hypothetical protein